MNALTNLPNHTFALLKKKNFVEEQREINFPLFYLTTIVLGFVNSYIVVVTGEETVDTIGWVNKLIIFLTAASLFLVRLYFSLSLSLSLS